MMKQHRLLLIDDDESVTSALAKLLRGDGFLVETAASAAHAVTVFSASPPDLVLLDLGLPDRDGWDVYEMMALIEPLTPIVVLTARPGQVTMACAAGIGALVEKPADPETLLRLIRRLLDESAQTRLERLVIGRPPTRWIQPGATRNAERPTDLPLRIS
jgi:two-component system KDP operon response regulator KdpE